MTTNENMVIDISKGFAPYHESPDKSNFHMSIGGTEYEVSTHFNEKGTQSVLQQFKELILSEQLI